MTEHKQHHCRECGVELIENDNWTPSNARKKDYICRSCNAKRCKAWNEQNKDKKQEYNKEWHKQNKDKRREYKKEYHKQNKDKRREYHLKSTYGIDEAEWNRMFEAQGGRCAICGSEDPKGNHGVFHVDHCHTTGKVRGLLCDTCNRGLGMFYDNTNTLKNAIEYLEAHHDHE